MNRLHHTLEGTSIRTRMGAGLVAGLLAALCGLAVPAASSLVWLNLLMGLASGISFGLLFGRWVHTPGAGLLWGATHGMLWWFVVWLVLHPWLLNQPADPLHWQIEQARELFPQLLRALTCYGGLVGLVYAVAAPALSGQRGFKVASRALRTYLGSTLIGGLAGLIGGLAFGVWMSNAGIFPLIAGLVGSDSPEVGRTLHFSISVVIGATFGLLFRQDMKGLGSSIAWGIAYGFIWWVVGALTLMPWWLGESVTWTLDAARQAFGSLIGHLVYGVLLGIVYAFIDRFVRLLFIESDPLYRDPEGPGTRSLRALGIGALASVAGGLIFTWVMVETGVLSLVAHLVGGTSPGVGFFVHMSISVIIGATYGLLFWRESATYGVSLAWGLIYGFVWWILGPLTLMPILLGGDLQWTLTAGLEAYPSLIGHLAYGATTALVSHYLIRRYTVPRRSALRQQIAAQIHTPLSAPAPVSALWAFVLVMGVTLPLLLAV